jgi:hypothetical protein
MVKLCACSLEIDVVKSAVRAIEEAAEEDFAGEGLAKGVDGRWGWVHGQDVIFGIWRNEART